MVRWSPLTIIGSSDEDNLRSFLHSATRDLPDLQVFDFHHRGFTPLRRTAKGHCPGVSHTPLGLASQDMDPVLTMLALLVFPLHLHVNLQQETIFHDDLTTLALHT